jgi:predicted NBD/HSP70 family sugar kinase
MASGNALVRERQQAGRDVDSVEAMIALARDAHPLAHKAQSRAAVMTYGVLATMANFFNP